MLATCGPFHRFVGTVAHGEAEWRHWLAFDRYAAIGYPRNDMLHKHPHALDEIDLAGVDRATWGRAGETLARGKRVLLYAPTLRDGRPAWLPVDCHVDLAIAEHEWSQKAGDIRRHGVSAFFMGDDWAGRFDELAALCEVHYLPRTERVSSTQIKGQACALAAR